MENFNKNWLAILLIVLVFFMLGFLTGRITGHGSGKHLMKDRIIKHKLGSDLKIDEDDDEVTVKIDTLKKDGKNIEVKVEKRLK